ncbi:MAG TPA: superoxide dismutase [Syntrophomonas sp.]|jgi:Cu-Zn family superoxide dismutase|nr:superoxide dismutase [Syntrophomonas sp.]
MPATKNGPAIIKAKIHGGPLRPQIRGTVTFTRAKGGGTNVSVFVTGLPPYAPANNGNPVGPHGFHLHEYGVCEISNRNDPFLTSGGHWNPKKQPHGNHAGDFPVLFSNNGTAKMSFYTNKFEPKDVVGHSVIIHMNPDDYRTQPSGDSGKRLACGIIKRYARK